MPLSLIARRDTLFVLMNGCRINMPIACLERLMLLDRLLRHPEPSKYRSPAPEYLTPLFKDILSPHVSFTSSIYCLQQALLRDYVSKNCSLLSLFLQYWLGFEDIFLGRLHAFTEKAIDNESNSCNKDQIRPRSVRQQ